MKKIFTLAFGLLLSMGSLFSQKIDYDHSSKWFLGLNLGTTWQTTDVSNQFGAGWGLTLGRSFNYNYGKKIYFDIRGRYLTGNWYGQDYDTTSLVNYNPTNQNGYALQTYKDSLGFSVNNFKTGVHRLALELAIHANGLRERTGIDAYIFGGVGFTWHKTYGDLVSNDAYGDSLLYNYDPAQLNKSYVSGLLDKSYETALDGTIADKYRVNFMPSLGFGIGYQVGPRISIGLEHKTTFTLLDNFDGYVDASSKYRDIYHYTSAFIQFRFRGGRTNNTENNLNNVNNYNTGGCISPVVNFINPASNALTVQAMNYQVLAEIKDVIGRENIVFKQNGVSNSNFTYNAQTDRLEAGVLLVPGMNTFEITAKNSCGSDVKTITINYVDCKIPTVAFVSPTVSGQTVTNASFPIAAAVQNGSNAQVTLTQNNVTVNNAVYNSVNGSLQGNVTLINGLNTFVVTVTNACGSNSATTTVNYQTCIVPTISFVNPSTTGTTVSSANFTLSAMVANGANSQVKVTHNTRTLTNVNFNATSGVLQSTVTLAPGVNTFVVTSTNACGTATQTITINYQNCIAPIITMVNPSVSGTTVTSPNFTLNASIQNANGNQGVSVKHNTRSITNFTLNAASGALQSAITLVEGVNTFVVSSTNACGTDTETITVIYQPCVAPSITVTTPVSNGLTVTNASFNLAATIANLNNNQGISLKQNNVSITNYSYNSATGSLQSSVTLAPGINTFVLTVTTSCGTDVETITVNYQPCVAPVITVVSPASNGQTVTTATYAFNALVQHSNNGQGITLKLNNTTITNYNFNSATGSLQSTLALIPGVNTLVLTTTNECGTDSETITITYQNCVAPSFTIVSPNTTGTTVNSANFNFAAVVQNSSSGQAGISLSLNGKAITNYAWNNGTGSLTSSVVLNPGLNTFVLTVNNPCGTVSETVTINYSNCVAPIVAITNPSTNGTTVSSASFTLNGTIQNSNNGQGITFTQNANAVTNFSFNNATGAFQSAVTLVPGLNTFVLSSMNACGTDAKTVTVNYVPCVAPAITIVTPAVSGGTVTSANFTLGALILNSNGGQGVSVKLNNVNVTNYNFNAATGALQANLTLAPGLNTIIVTSTTPCGTDSKTVTVKYDNCIPPVVSITSPPANGTTVSNANFVITAQIQNAPNGQAIAFTQNGRTLSNATFNAQTGAFVGNVTLSPGMNSFVITVTSPCGTVTQTVTVNYENCVAPTVTLNNQLPSGSIVSDPAFTFNALLTNMASGQGIVYTLNGSNSTPANFNSGTGALTSNVSLSVGINTFVVSATNACGTASQTYTVTYKPCVLPTISIVNPTNGATLTSDQLTFSASVLNVANSAGIVFTQNGVPFTNFTFNGTVGFVGKVTLKPGLNTFVLTATNDCGTVTETVSVTYNNCKPPVVLSNNTPTSGGNVSNAPFTYTVSLQNITAPGQIMLTFNGNTNYPFSFNPATGVLSSSMTLSAGVNTIQLTATNECGKANDLYTVTYTPCTMPVIVLGNPSTSGTTVTNASVNFNANVLNINQNSTVTVTQNGSAIGGFTYNPATGFTGKVVLVQGMNTFVITATNDCGTVTQTVTVNYEPCIAPEIQFINPASNGITVNDPNFNVQAMLTNASNASNVALSMNGRPLTTFTVNNATGLLSGNIVLTTGANTITIVTTTPCGTATQSIIVNYVAGTGSGSTDQGGSGNGGQIGVAMVTICHTENGVSTTMEIPVTQLAAHQKHGDKVGACVEEIKGGGKTPIEKAPKVETPIEKGGSTPVESQPKTVGSGRGGQH